MEDGFALSCGANPIGERGVFLPRGEGKQWHDKQLAWKSCVPRVAAPSLPPPGLSRGHVDLWEDRGVFCVG